MLVKLYGDRASRIGVRFIYEYQAVREYEQLLSRHPDRRYSLSIELVRNKADLTLTGEETGARVQYKGLEYKTEQLKKLQTFADPAQGFNFVHVFPKHNTLLVAKPFRRPEFLLIPSVQFFSL